jgi:hypothetical protein
MKVADLEKGAWYSEGAMENPTYLRFKGFEGGHYCFDMQSRDDYFVIDGVIRFHPASIEFFELIEDGFYKIEEGPKVGFEKFLSIKGAQCVLVVPSSGYLNRIEHGFTSSCLILGHPVKSDKFVFRDALQRVGKIFEEFVD